MRATISFETDVDQVEGTMAVLACSEEHNLRAAADILANYSILDGSVLDTINEVVRLLDQTTVQLRQYQKMMLSFERSRFETMIPQPADTARLDTGAMKAFDSFVNSIEPPRPDADKEQPNAASTEEG
ncbi:MAG TPA: hypothetical protein DEQ32_13755 [Gammaproteobacteria bacterium]|nr:hypothetical protein [Gammaproteobacteria bacterium]